MSFDDGLMEGGVPGFKFDKVGDACEGVVESVEKRQQTHMETGKPEFWDDGNPKYQFIFTLQTSQRTDETDDGRRRLYAKKPSKMLQAIQDAVRLTKHDGSVVGGTLKVGFAGTEPAKSRGFSPIKLYRARFTPPVANAASDWGAEPGSDGAGS